MPRIEIFTPDKIPTRLPLLDFVAQYYHLDHMKPFKGYRILAIQHLLGTSLPLFDMFERGGARPEDIYIVGKAYSSHPEVVQRLINRGYRVDPHAVFDNNEDEPYDHRLQEHIAQTFTTMLKDRQLSGDNRQALLIDDGGKAIKLLSNEQSNVSSSFVAVEQTSRGARLVNALRLRFPVINVARSEAKTIHESPSIGKAMVEGFLDSLNRWEVENVYHLEQRHALVLGYGFVGESVVKELQLHGFNVSVYDSDQQSVKKAMAKSEITVVQQRRDAFKVARVIVGCTGNPSLPEEERKEIAPGTLLVNMASTDTEFNAWNLRRQENIVVHLPLPSDMLYLKEFFPLPWRSLYRINEEQTHYYLANGGFPADFTGKINPVPVEEIQLTAALLLGGAIQATLEHTAGLIDLDPALQESVIDKYLIIKKSKT